MDVHAQRRLLDAGQETFIVPRIGCDFSQRPQSSCSKKFCALVNYLTLWRRKKMQVSSTSSTRRRGDANARMDGGNRRRGRDWPDLVVRRDVQLGPRGRPGNEFGRDIAAC